MTRLATIAALLRRDKIQSATVTPLWSSSYGGPTTHGLAMGEGPASAAVLALKRRWRQDWICAAVVILIAALITAPALGSYLPSQSWCFNRVKAKPRVTHYMLCSAERPQTPWNCADCTKIPVSECKYDKRDRVWRRLWRVVRGKPWRVSCCIDALPTDAPLMFFQAVAVNEHGHGSWGEGRSGCSIVGATLGCPDENCAF